MRLLHVNIEPTNICQLSCAYCGDKKTRKLGAMGFRDYKRILDMIPESTEIRLFLSGEPMLNSNLPFMVMEAFRRGHVVLIHTNGGFLHGSAKEMILAGYLYPKQLTISISVHVPFKELKGGIEKLIFINNLFGKPVHIILQKIVPYPAPLDVPAGWKEYENDVEFSIRYPHNWIGEDVKGSEKQKWKVPCGFIEDSVAIYWNGDVTTCCTDLNGKNVVGNIYKDRWDNIIGRIDKIARLQVEGKADICNGCERYDEAVNRVASQ